MAYEALPDTFRDDFATTWDARIARRETDFFRFCKKVKIDGKRKRFNQSDILDMSLITGRAAATVISERTTYFRWLIPQEFDLTERLDEFDQDNLGDIALPSSDIMMQQVDAYNRKVDAVILDAAEGSATVGADGSSTQALTQTVDSDYDDGATDTGMTLKKILRANRYFKDNDLKREEKVFVYAPECEAALLESVNETKSSDFINIKSIPNGSLDGEKLLGFTWVCHTGLTEVTGGGGQGGNIVRNLAWATSQIRFGDGQREVFTDIIPQNRHALQIRTRARMGAYRNEEKGVVAINTLLAS